MKHVELEEPRETRGLCLREFDNPRLENCASLTTPEFLRRRQCPTLTSHAFTGASELIDLVIRNAKPGRWRPGPQRTQYKEYARSAIAAGFTTTRHNDRSATLLCVVNPTNPTGDYWTISEMKTFIERGCDRGTTVIVGEYGEKDGLRAFNRKLIIIGMFRVDCI